MYLELSKLKDEMSHIRTKSRGKPDYFAKQVIYPGDREFSLAPPQKKDEQRYQQNSNNQSVRSSTIFDYSSGLPLFNGAPQNVQSARNSRNRLIFYNPPSQDNLIPAQRPPFTNRRSPNFQMQSSQGLNLFPINEQEFAPLSGSMCYLPKIQNMRN